MVGKSRQGENWGSYLSILSILPLCIWAVESNPDKGGNYAMIMGWFWELMCMICMYIYIYFVYMFVMFGCDWADWRVKCMRPVLASVASGSVTGALLTFARDIASQNFQLPPAPTPSEVCSLIPPLPQSWTLDWTSFLIGLCIGCLFLPLLDLLLILRLAWIRALRHTIPNRPLGPLHRIVAWATALCPPLLWQLSSEPLAFGFSVWKKEQLRLRGVWLQLRSQCVRTAAEDLIWSLRGPVPPWGARFRGQRQTQRFLVQTLRGVGS